MTRAFDTQITTLAGTLFVLASAIGVGGCDHTPTPAPTEEPLVGAQLAPSEPPVLGEPDLCLTRIAELNEVAELGGAPRFEENRVEILGRARAVPVVFLRRPVGSAGPEDMASQLRRQLEEAGDPTGTIVNLLRRTRRDLSLRRDVFLPEGYLYAEFPLLALRLSQIVRLDHLFDSPTVTIHRGGEVLTAVREDGKYWRVPPSSVDRSLPRSQRKTAEQETLLLFDRVLAGSVDGEAAGGRELPEALHMDFRPLRESLHFSYLTVRRMTEDGSVVTLHTGPVDTTAVIRPVQGTAVLECEVHSGGESELQAAREQGARNKELVDPILASAREMVERQLPFDEPRTEEGQQDGKLREGFWDAYWRYRELYEFNGDQYYVFDGYGRARLPQVCIDFITDAFDWGTGGRWPSRNEKRVYTKGAFRFKSFGLENPRSVEEIAGFASETPEWFDMHWLEDSERVKFKYRKKFFQVLSQHPERYQRGDVVFIYGLRDDERFHYHSFFIDERDPVSGIPTLLSANAGPPQLRTWEGEMQNAPRRSIVARMRVRDHVLEQAYRQAREKPGVPLEPPRRPDDDPVEENDD